MVTIGIPPQDHQYTRSHSNYSVGEILIWKVGKNEGRISYLSYL